jgi:pimeloyl-ACP methyl ester carboxylesterase
MRAIEPFQSGQVKLAGFQIGYETFGDPTAPAVLLLPTWQGVHSRLWKMQVHTLARFFHVITYDSPGNGGGERTANVAAFEYNRVVDQGVGLLDYLRVARAAVVAISRGCWYALDMAGRYPERVARTVLISNFIAPDFQFTDDPACWERRDAYEGWQKWNYYYYLEHIH